MTDFVKRLTELMKAGYAGLTVNSPEALRVEIHAMTAAKRMDYGFQRWTVTRGWAPSADPEEKADGTTDPFTAVQSIPTTPHGRLFLMHAFPEMFSDPALRQAFRDTLAIAKGQKKTVLLVGQFDLPPDLEKDFSVVEFDLPGREELSSLAKSLCEANEIPAPKNGELAKAVDAALGLTVMEAEDAFSLSLVRKRKLDPEATMETKKQIVRKGGLLEFVETPESLSTIGGLDELKAWLVQREKGFSPKARDFGLEPPKGVLMVGVPGCGKSLTAKALAAAWRLPLLKLDMGRLFGSLVGQSEANLRSALKTAEAVAPCILWLDEIEQGLAGSEGGSTDGGTTQRVMGTFLNWLQDRPKDKPVFVIATGNDVSRLPAQLLRKGRWDEIFSVDLPTEEERAAIAEVHLKKRGRGALATADGLTSIVAATDGFTGSEVEEAIKAGLWKAFAQDRELTAEDVVAAAKETVPLSVTAKERMDAFRAWAEGRARPASRAKAPSGATGSAARRLNLTGDN